MVASLLGAGKIEMVAQSVEKARPRPDAQLRFRAVHDEGDRCLAAQARGWKSLRRLCHGIFSLIQSEFEGQAESVNGWTYPIVPGRAGAAQTLLFISAFQPFASKSGLEPFSKAVAHICSIKTDTIGTLSAIPWRSDPNGACQFRPFPTFPAAGRKAHYATTEQGPSRASKAD